MPAEELPSPWERFGELLRQYMHRAGIGRDALAQRLGVSPTTVTRWRRGETRPAEENLEALRTQLSWVDKEGNAHALSGPEFAELQQALHYLPRVAPIPEQDANRIESPDRCLVYSYSYQRRSFPIRWDERAIEVERDYPRANLDLMLQYLSAITRPSEYYQHSYHKLEDYYDDDVLQRWAERLEERRSILEERLRYRQVRHLYHKESIERYLSNASTVQRYAGVPEFIRRKQADYTLYLLTDTKFHDNFEVGLATQPFPTNMEIVGDDVALLEFDQYAKVLPQYSVMGIEIHGLRAVRALRDQFESSWGDKGTVKNRDSVIKFFKKFASR